MRILYVVHGFVPEAVGGIELHCHNLASALAADHEVAVLTWDRDAARPEYAVDERNQNDVKVWRLNHRYTDLDAFRGIYRNDRIDDLFDDLVGKWNPEVVHVHHVIGLSIGILERTKRRRLPLVLGLHDFWFGCPKGQRIRHPLVLCERIDRTVCVPCLKPQNYELRAPRSPWWRWLRGLRPPTTRRGLRILRDYDRDMKRVLTLPDAFITPSEFHRSAYADYGADIERIHIIPYGLPGAAEVRGPRQREQGPTRIGFLGTLIPSKGAHVLLEAFRLLERPDATLEFHGAWVPYHGDTGYLDRLREAAATLSGTVRFHGRYEQEDVPRILESLDVLVVPSVWYESYSIVIREGFLAGVPVVASGHGAMAEAIDDGVNGLTFRPGDAADLARQLRRLLDDPGLRERLASHPKKVSSIEENAARHLEIYRSFVTASDHST